MCLKTDTLLLQYAFYQFQYFITIYLCMVEIYQEIFQSSSFNESDKWGWSRFIDKLVCFRQRLKYQNDQILLNSYIQVGDQIPLIV